MCMLFFVAAAVSILGYHVGRTRSWVERCKMLCRVRWCKDPYIKKLFVSNARTARDADWLTCTFFLWWLQRVTAITFGPYIEIAEKLGKKIQLMPVQRAVREEPFRSRCVEGERHGLADVYIVV